MNCSKSIGSAVQNTTIWPQKGNDFPVDLGHEDSPPFVDIVLIASIFVAVSTALIQWRCQPVTMESWRRILHSWIMGPLSLWWFPDSTPRNEDSYDCTTSRHGSQTPESLSRLEDKCKSKVEFIRRVESQYGYATSKKGFIDDWRPTEFPTLIEPLKLKRDGHLSVQNQYPATLREGATELEVYLDYAGSALPTKSQLSRIFDFNRFQILANPHSLGGGIASDRSWKLIQMARTAVMRHFGVSDDTQATPTSAQMKGLDGKKGATMYQETLCPSYQLVFTSGATDSLRLVAERFPWSNLKFTSPCDSHLSLIAKRGDDIVSNIEAEDFRFQSLLLYPQNVHTSVVGMRNVAIARGARFQCISPSELLKATPEWFRLVNDGATNFEGTIKSNDSLKLNPQQVSTKKIWLHHLLVLPLECNFGGDRFDWRSTIAAAKSSSSTSCTYTITIQNTSQSKHNATIQIVHKWNVLFDIAKAAATSPVHLPTIAPDGGPDYAVLSFYKLFGLPTGLGCLFIKTQPDQQREVQQQLSSCESTATASYDPVTKILVGDGLILETSSRSKHYFGGGSVDLVLPKRDFTVHRHAKRTHVHTKFDGLFEGNRGQVDLGTLSHGTEHFRGIADLAAGFQEIADLGGMEAISSHSTCLAAELVRRFRRLVHDNNASVVQIYGQWNYFQFGTKGIDERSPGPTVAFNITDRDGAIIGYDEVSRLAALNRPPIQLRTGCFCNPGACQEALSLCDNDITEQYASGHVCGDRRGIVNGKPTGAIRASFGKDSIWEDMDALASFIEKVFVSRRHVSLPTQQLNSGANQSDNEPLVVASLFVFPIKSCAAMRVRRWPINRCTGKLAFDREFALVDSSGAAMRLHSYPKMSQIESKIDLEDSIMTVSAPGHTNLVLSLHKTSDTAFGVSDTPRDIEVCGALCKGSVWGGPEASKWFSSVLGIRCWLARHYERVDHRKKSDTGHTGKESYSNEAALLVVSQRSISVLNSIIVSQGWGQQVDSRHFRPNIVISSMSSYGNDDYQQDSKNENYYPDRIHPEDSWVKIFISCEGTELELSAIGKCARCQMVDIDPTSGMKGNTLRALAQYRRERGKINFGTFFAGIENESIDDDNIWVAEGCTVKPVRMEF